MREFSVTGNLAADAEVLTSKNGDNYIRFRMANREFGDAENETRWFDVTMFSIPKISSYLKKGTGVRVIGDYKDSIYQSEKYGAQINRNITAFKVDFWNGGKRDEQNQEGAQQPQVKAPEPAQVEKPKSPKAAAKPAPAPVAPVVNDNDDLPF